MAASSEKSHNKVLTATLFRGRASFFPPHCFDVHTIGDQNVSMSSRLRAKKIERDITLSIETFVKIFHNDISYNFFIEKRNIIIVDSIRLK
jgi:hypothetical protein